MLRHKKNIMPYSQKKKKRSVARKSSTVKKYRVNGGKTRTLNSTSVKFTGLKPATVTSGEGGLLKYQSPSSYAQSLLDPFKYQDVRIPDLSTHPTGVFSVTKDLTFTYNAATSSSDGGSAWLIGLGSVPFYQTVVPAANGNRIQGVDLAGKCRTNFSQARLVSAGVVMRYNGNDSNCSGNITCAVLSALDPVGGKTAIDGSGVVASTPIHASASTFVAGSNKASEFWEKVGDGSSLAAVRNSYFGPVVDGCRMTYRPLDSDDFGLNATWSHLASFSDVVPYLANSFSDGVLEQAGSTSPVPHYFLCRVSGVSSGTPTFNISVTLNYEGIPVDDTVGVPLSGVYCNPSSQAYGLNMAANARQCTSATTYEISKVDKMVRGL